MTKTITATAPVRTCDCGGWTDTWFARRGAVFHIAVNPGIRVRVRPRPLAAREAATVALHAENYGDRYTFVPGTRPWLRHPLLEAAVASEGVPPGLAVDVSVWSAVPPGASAGTSAAVCVALLGALRTLWGRSMDPDGIAAAAHAVEVERLGQQSGLQDQIAAAHGGINYIEIPGYPNAVRHAVQVSDETRAALQRRLLLVYLGRTHSSSAIHEEVIREIGGPGSAGRAALAALREAAADARDAVAAGDLEGLGDAMRANTEAQRRLHPSLIGTDAERVIAAAREAGALGWKINGAGGEGGSMAILCGPEAGSRAAAEAAIVHASSAYQLLSTSIAPAGLEVVVNAGNSDEAA